jgi:hypothetical protein
MQNHPLVESAQQLQALISEWSQALEGPRKRAIEGARVELDQARADSKALQVELDAMRKAMVLEKLDRKSLRIVRGKLHDAETLIGDLEAGIIEAERQCRTRAGAPAIEACRNLIRSVTAIRNGRAAIVAAVERGGDPARNAAQVFAEIGAARAWVAEAVAEVHRHGGDPEGLEGLVSQVRASLDAVIQDVQPYNTLKRAA